MTEGSVISIPPKTAADFVWAEAMFIAEHGWRPLADATQENAEPGPDLALAACWAVYGGACRPRDLDDVQSDHVATLLDAIEKAAGGKTVAELEQEWANTPPKEVAWELGKLAWEIERELRKMIND